MPKDEIQPGIGGVGGPKRGDTSGKTAAVVHEGFAVAAPAVTPEAVAVPSVSLALSSAASVSLALGAVAGTNGD